MKNTKNKKSLKITKRFISKTAQATLDQALAQKIADIQFDIHCHQQSIKRLFAFACGLKKLKNPRLKPYQRTEADDRQLLKTVACLRTQIERSQQALAMLLEVKPDDV